MRLDAEDLLLTIGAVLVTGGAWVWHPPAAAVALGVLLMGWAVLLGIGKSGRQRQQQDEVRDNR
jgi:hypothetical protein